MWTATSLTRVWIQSVWPGGNSIPPVSLLGGPWSVTPRPAPEQAATPCSPAPWVCLSDVMKREPAPAACRGGSLSPHSPLEVPPPGVSTVFCSGPRRVLSVGDPTARILSWSVLRSYCPAASSAEPRAPAKRRLDRFPCLAANRVGH